VWPKHVAPLIKPLLTPYCRKESCDLTVINKAYNVTAGDSYGPLGSKGLIILVQNTPVSWSINRLLELACSYQTVVTGMHNGFSNPSFLLGKSNERLRTV
jgi:hypothetical protein